MRPLLKGHDDVGLRDRDRGGRIHEIAKQVVGLGLGIAVPDLGAEEAYKLLAMRVSCRSQLTFIGTADERASM